MDAVYDLEEGLRFVHRHGQDIGDRFAAEFNFQRFAVVARALARVAGDEYVGQKMHFDFNQPVALAGFAAAAFDVEAEAAGLVAAGAAFGELGEPVADRREQVGVGGGIATRCAADRALVDIDDFIDLIEPIDAGVGGWHFARAHQFARDGFVQRVDHQRGFAAAGDAGDAGEHAQRKRRGDVAQIVGRGADHGEFAFRIDETPLCRDRNATAARQVIAGQAFDVARYLGRGVPLAMTWPPLTPARGPMSIR